MRHTFINEVTTTMQGMRATRHLEFVTSGGEHSRTVVWEREAKWGDEQPLPIAAHLTLAVLSHMGLRPVDDGWWHDIHPDVPTPHLYAVLERIPGSTGGWKDWPGPVPDYRLT